MDLIEVAGSLKRDATQPAEGAVRFGVPVLFDVPTRRFGAKIDAHSQGNGGNEGGPDLEAPCDVSDIVNGQVSAEALER